MNRTDLIRSVADEASLSQTDVDKALNALESVLTSALTSGDAVTVPGFLKVERTERAARTGRNPRTGESMQIPAGYSVKLTAGSRLKAAVSY